MSLLDTASLVVTPNGTKAGKLYSVVPSDGSGDLSVTRATTATRVNSSGLIESVASNVPRLDYTNGSCPSILVEPQRTNLALRSQEFDNIVYSKVNATVTPNATTAPDGTLTADKIESTISGVLEIVQTTINGNAKTISFYAKAGSINIVNLWVGSTVTFNLTSGTVTAGSGTIENVGNGWFRCIVSNTTFLNFNPFLITSASGQFVYLWGVQMELGSYATSYIPTTSASVTRNADVISKTGISSLIGQTEGVIFFDFVYTQLDINGLIPITIIQNSSNHAYFYIDGNEKISFDFIYSGVDVVSIETANGFAVKGQRYKVAFAYKQNDFVVYINGVQIGTDNSGLIPSFSELNFGYPYASGYTYPSTINLSALWKTRLTNTQLAQLTTI
jgi:hypothetical protein